MRPYNKHTSEKLDPRGPTFKCSYQKGNTNDSTSNTSIVYCVIIYIITGKVEIDICESVNTCVYRQTANTAVPAFKALFQKISSIIEL